MVPVTELRVLRSSSLLAGAWPSSEHSKSKMKRRTLDEDGVAGVNGALVCYAHRQVYAADASFAYSRQYHEKPRLGSSLVKDQLFLKKRQQEH
jgi:hypothetical protein